MFNTQVSDQNKFFKTNIYNSESLMKFIKGVSIRNKNTAKQYYSRLTIFEKFVNKEYEINIDKLIQKLKSKEYDPYDILNDFCVFLQNNYNLSSVSFRDRIVTVKTFFEYNDIEISPRKFKLKVRFPKAVLRHKDVDKEDIIKILNGCSDLRLKTYVMLLAATGCRAVEALSIRVKDLDFESNPAKLRIRGQYTKTKVDRYVFLTKEIIEQIKIWIDYKYRKRRICYKDKETGENITEYRTWNKSNYGDYIAFYVIQPLGKIIGFGKIVDKYVDDQLVWPDEILFKKSIWKYKIRYEIFYLVDQWDSGINPPVGIMLNTGRKVVDRSLFMKMIDDSENKWNIQQRMF